MAVRELGVTMGPALAGAGSRVGRKHLTGEATVAGRGGLLGDF